MAWPQLYQHNGKYIYKSDPAPQDVEQLVIVIIIIIIIIVIITIINNKQ